MNLRSLFLIEKKLRNAIGRIIDTGSITLTLSNGGISKIIRLFGKTIRKKKKEICHKNPVFYLKVNRDTDYSLQCIQGWLDVIKEIHAEYYIVCDNKVLEYKILRNCKFKDDNVQIIPSMKLNHIIKHLYTGNWKFATRAHLTPFYHAKEHGFIRFWEIDADDTSFLMNPKRIANALKQVEKESEEKRLAAVSLDMWYSKTGERHWSFGIAYFNTFFCDFISEFESESSYDWMQRFSACGSMNLDWYFNYLRQSKKYPIESFYIDNCVFIHWGSFIVSPFSAWIVQYKDGYLLNLVFMQLYDNNALGKLPISLESIKIENDYNSQDYKNVLENSICIARKYGKEIRELYLVPPDFANGNKE